MDVEQMHALCRQNQDICTILSSLNENGSAVPVVLGKPARWVVEEERQ
jgi:hypothetical protein